MFIQQISAGRFIMVFLCSTLRLGCWQFCLHLVPRYLQINCSELLKSCDVKTLPYPGFPTDLQPQLMSLLTTCSGQSVLEETVFEGRMRHGVFHGLINSALSPSPLSILKTLVLILTCLWFSGGATKTWSTNES